MRIRGPWGISNLERKPKRDEMTDATESMGKDEANIHELGNMLHKNGAQWQVCYVNMGAAEAECLQRGSSSKKKRAFCQADLTVLRPPASSLFGSETCVSEA